ncbi:MAG: hypothetical protein Q8M96_22305, partial [Rubrivivax sp.]|nr:hypothetical protein [Rubrivivax sp.]
MNANGTLLTPAEPEPSSPLVQHGLAHALHDASALLAAVMQVVDQRERIEHLVSHEQLEDQIHRLVR